MVAEVEFHPGQLLPRIGFIVTNRSCRTSGCLPSAMAEAPPSNGSTRGSRPLSKRGCLHTLRRQRRPARAQCAGLHPRQRPADNRDVGRHRDVVAQLAARAVFQDGRAARAPRPIRCFPAGGGGVAPRGVSTHLGSDRRRKCADRPGYTTPHAVGCGRSTSNSRLPVRSWPPCSADFGWRARILSTNVRARKWNWVCRLHDQSSCPALPSADTSRTASVG